MSYPYPPKSVRLKFLFEKLTKLDPVNNREDAFLLLENSLQEVEDHYQVPHGDFAIRMKAFSFQTNTWNNLNSDPCYWDDPFKNSHRVYIYKNGGIKIVKFDDGVEKILLDKPGA